MTNQLTPHFHLSEFICKDGSPVPPEFLGNVQRLAEQLEVLRVTIGSPIVILSGYRTPSWNAGKGVEHSQHLTASAADIRIADMDPHVVRQHILDLVHAGKMTDGGIGYYPSSATRRLGWVHYDVRAKPARWNG